MRWWGVLTDSKPRERDGGRGTRDEGKTEVLAPTALIPAASDLSFASPAPRPSSLPGGFDVAIGTRRVANALIEAKPPLHRYLLGEMYVWLASKLLGCRVSDFNCGFKAFRAEAAERLFRLQRRNDWSFDAEVLALAGRLGYRIKEVPVRWAHAQATSKVKPIRDGIRSFLALLAIRRDIRAGRYETERT